MSPKHVKRYEAFLIWKTVSPLIRITDNCFINSKRQIQPGVCLQMAVLKWRNYLPVSLLMLPFAQPYISTFSRNNKFRTSEEVICHFNFSQLTLGITFPLPQELSSPSHTSQTPSPFPPFKLL